MSEGPRMRPSALVLDADEIEPLHRPVLLVALHGFFDVAEVATSAAEAALAGGLPVTLGEIDCDRFFDFTLQRPEIAIDEDGPYVVWPDATFRALRNGRTGRTGADGADGGRDVVALVGYEPHLEWSGYVDCVLAAIDELGVELVITLGATPEVTPHTRMPTVVGSSTDAALAARYGLQAPSYQGVTGLIGVLHAALDDRSIPSVSLRVGVPHYLGGGEHPRAVSSLVQHLAHVIDVALPIDLATDISDWDELHDRAIADDATMTSYVRVLEREYDRRAEASLASGDELAEQFQRFLRPHD